jgi:hypothetical protein
VARTTADFDDRRLRFVERFAKVVASNAAIAIEDYPGGAGDDAG